jgi:glycosyltransferase involved in cell wall biosynthesis
MKVPDLKILHITPYYLPYAEYGGPVYSVSNLCDSLVEYGLKVTIYTTYKHVKTEHPFKISHRINMMYFHAFFSARLFFAPNLILHLLRNIRKYDVVHISMWWNLTSMLSLLIAVLFRKTVILSPRGNLSEYTFNHSKSFFKKIFHRLFNRSVFRKTILHATTDAELEECKKIADWKLEVVIPNLVKVPRLNGQMKTYGRDKMNILFISRIDSKKGLDLLIKALADVSFDFSLTIAGNGSETYINALKALAAKMNIAHKIIWYGFANDEQKMKLYVDHDLMVLPSHNENFANVVIESLALGTPVLISDKVGLYRFVEKHHLGWICQTEEHHIREQLEKIYAAPAALQSASQAAPDIIAKEFDHNSIVDRYLDLYVYP